MPDGLAALRFSDLASSARTALPTASARARCRLSDERKSLPSLLMVSRDLTKVLDDRYPAEAETRDYLERLGTLSAIPAVSAQLPGSN